MDDPIVREARQPPPTALIAVTADAKPSSSSLATMSSSFHSFSGVVTNLFAYPTLCDK
jgi:hypothetical protein